MKKNAKKIFKFEVIDFVIAMVIAGGINASMLIVSAALFNKAGLQVDDLEVAFSIKSFLSAFKYAL